MPLLTQLSWKRGSAPPPDAGFPFSVPTIRTLKTLTFRAPITFFVGENGSGKSTLLEAIALAANLPTVGARDLARDPTLDKQRELARALRLGWARKSGRGFFLRAEDFFGFVQRLSAERAALLAELAETTSAYTEQDRSAYALTLATGPLQGSLGEMSRRYGVDLDANSHGESFLRLFQSRFIPGGLHLLDEPEAALSPQSQLTFIAMLLGMIGEGAQFIIATHAPILLGCPRSEIMSFDSVPPKKVSYDELPHVTLTRDFLNDRQRILRHLMDDGTD